METKCTQQESTLYLYLPSKSFDMVVRDILWGDMKEIRFGHTFMNLSKCCIMVKGGISPPNFFSRGYENLFVSVELSRDRME